MRSDERQRGFERFRDEGTDDRTDMRAATIGGPLQHRVLRQQSQGIIPALIWEEIREVIQGLNMTQLHTNTFYQIHRIRPSSSEPVVHQRRP